MSISEILLNIEPFLKQRGVHDKIDIFVNGKEEEISEKVNTKMIKLSKSKGNRMSMRHDNGNILRDKKKYIQEYLMYFC